MDTKQDTTAQEQLEQNAKIVKGFMDRLMLEHGLHGTKIAAGYSTSLFLQRPYGDIIRGQLVIDEGMFDVLRSSGLYEFSHCCTGPGPAIELLTGDPSIDLYHSSHFLKQENLVLHPLGFHYFNLETTLKMMFDRSTFVDTMLLSLHNKK